MDKVSPHEIRVYRLLSESPDQWFSNENIVTHTDVAPRTARLHTASLYEKGLLERADVFPGLRYRWSSRAAQNNRAYLARLVEASHIMEEAQ